ncbi:MAG: hypothetical protein AAF639_46290 [Chloroflexota bacterium]
MSTQAELTQPKWWDQIPRSAVAGDLATGDIGGDVIIATVSGGAKNVAIGKNITQSVQEILGAPTPDDGPEVTRAIDEVSAKLKSLEAEIGAGMVKMASSMWQQIAAEVEKASKQQNASGGAAGGNTSGQGSGQGSGQSSGNASTEPNGEVIKSMGETLLDSLPQLTGALASFFATPAVGRIVGMAGEALVAWIKEKFG